MAVVFDKASGRLVRETDAERAKREAEERQRKAGITTTTTTSAPARPEGQGQPATTTGRARSAEQARLEAIAKEYGKRPRRYIPDKDGFPTTEPKNKTGSSGSSLPQRDKAVEARNIFDAIAGLERTARGGAESQLESIRNLYAPQVSYAETARADELAELERILGLSRGEIEAVTNEYLQNLAPTRAFENVPLIAMEAEQNPLLAALASQGAGTQEIESQRALDTALANQMRALSERASQQYGATESAYVDALRRAAQGAQASGLSALTARGVQERSAIGSRYADFLNQLRTSQAEAEAQVSQNLQEQIMKIAEERAKAVEEYGVPKKRKVQTQTAGARGGARGGARASAL